MEDELSSTIHLQPIAGCTLDLYRSRPYTDSVSPSQDLLSDRSRALCRPPLIDSRRGAFDVDLVQCCGASTMVCEYISVMIVAIAVLFRRSLIHRRAYTSLDLITEGHPNARAPPHAIFAFNKCSMRQRHTAIIFHTHRHSSDHGVSVSCGVFMGLRIVSNANKSL